MSNRPLKVSDQKKLNKIAAKKKKQIEFLYQLPPYMFIISEGTKTEPNYIKGIVDKINQKYNKYTSGTPRILVHGTGRNTIGLLEYARKAVEEQLPEAESVWLMYDKDDFPADNFDNTCYSAEQKIDKREYHAIWSNECIELWFFLNFQEMNSSICREDYYKLLDNHFKNIGFEKYDKNIPNIYDILKPNTDIAINRAERQYSSYKDTTPSRCNPATKVYELIKELKLYL